MKDQWYIGGFPIEERTARRLILAIGWTLWALAGAILSVLLVLALR